ncbi:MAG: methyltransferase domain-containing protein [bacterium]|nr:methyltransferase domain-containing protein [bacterium]
MDSKTGFTPLSLQKLNLGCGSDIKDGWVNLNIVHLPGVDVVHDIEKLPLPFADNSFNEILCQDILEHVEYIPILKDIYRILVPGGSVRIRVPHFTSRNNYTDPTHKKRFSVSTFDYFAKNTYIWIRKRGEFYFEFAFDRLEDLRINFDKQSSRFFFYNRLIEWYVNSSPRRQVVYEMSGFCYLFPASDIEVTLVK